MATNPNVQCPLCHSGLAHSKDLEDHLIEEHSPEELAKSIVSQWEEAASGETLD